MAKDKIRYQHKGTDICVRNYWNKTELLFNDTVVDTWKGVVSVTFTLNGQIGEDSVDLVLYPIFVGATMKLFINGQPVAKAWTL